MRYDDLQVAEACLDAGAIDEALNVLDALLRARGDPVRKAAARRLRAAIHARQPDPDSLRAALADLDAIKGPARPDDHLLRSVICERLDRIDDALAAIETGCDRHRRHPRLAEYRLHLLRRAGRLDDAQRVAAAWIAASPADWQWPRWAAEIAAEAGADDAALAHYIQAREKLAAFIGDSADPSYTPLIAALMLAQAAILARLDRLAEADALYVQAADLVPDDPLIAFNRGLLAARRGDIDTAAALCEQALRAGTSGLQAYMRRALASDERCAALRERLGIT